MMALARARVRRREAAFWPLFGRPMIDCRSFSAAAAAASEGGTSGGLYWITIADWRHLAAPRRVAARASHAPCQPARGAIELESRAT